MSREEYRNLEYALGGRKAADRHIASRLRELADIVESDEWPDVISWQDDREFEPMMTTVKLTLSLPLGG